MNDIWWLIFSHSSCVLSFVSSLSVCFHSYCLVLLLSCALVLFPCLPSINHPSIPRLLFPLVPSHQLPVSNDRIDGEYDWSVVRNAWWAAIRIAYEYKDNWLPQHLPLEMRVMGNSDVALGPQKDFDLTCTMEILTLHRQDSKPPYYWFEYCQKITDAWSATKDKSGNPVKMRPHWAKAWDMRGELAKLYIYSLQICK